MQPFFKPQRVSTARGRDPCMPSPVAEELARAVEQRPSRSGYLGGMGLRPTEERTSGATFTGASAPSRSLRMTLAGTPTATA